MKIIIPRLASASGVPATGGVVSMNSITVPRAELYDCQSIDAAYTSANRLSA